MSKIIIVGNGFDLWNGIDTSFECFRNYYYENQRTMIKALKVPVYNIINGHLITDLELLYGDSYYPFSLDNTFWNEFENILADISYANVVSQFHNSSFGLLEMAKSLENAKRILDYSFQNWISSIQIPTQNVDYVFTPDCYFISFNYTETLTSLYNVNHNDIFYIHGCRDDLESIVYGHTMHPNLPPEAFKKTGELDYYLVAKARYDFDKHAIDNYFKLLSYFELAQIDFNQIEDIYVLGHSLNIADSYYFLLLSNLILDKSSRTKEYVITSQHIRDYESYIPQYEIDYDDYIACKRRLPNYESELVNIKAFEEAGFLADDGPIIFEKYKEELSKRYRFNNPNSSYSDRKIYPKWHISFYKPEERTHFSEVIEGLGWSKHRYEIDTMDNILKRFKI